MVGYPGEDEQDISETITYLKAANPTHFTITVAYPIKGTSLYNEIEDKTGSYLQKFLISKGYENDFMFQSRGTRFYGRSVGFYLISKKDENLRSLILIRFTYVDETDSSVGYVQNRIRLPYGASVSCHFIIN